MTLKFNTEELRARLEVTCLGVIEQFDLPDMRLLCFFDSENAPELVRAMGSNFCGFFTPVNGDELSWPPRVHEHFYDQEFNLMFNYVIYLRDTTCESPLGAAITLSHELQHLVQHARTFKVWWANTLLYHNMLGFDPRSSAKPWDIPSELDAMSMSKRVSEGLFSVDAVKAYADARIQCGDDPLKWAFFQRIDSAELVDVLEKTKSLVQLYKNHLIALNPPDIDFTKREWWK